MATTGKATHSRPTEMPVIILVAGPVLLASAIDLTGERNINHAEEKNEGNDPGDK
jgi:hypothetical protein